VLPLVFLLATPVLHADSFQDEEDSVENRAHAAEPVLWHGRRPVDPVNVKILAINDFHGQISTGKRVGGRPVGGAAVLSAYFHDAWAGMEDSTLLVEAGDLVGASPASSALLQDEPTIMLLNRFANTECRYSHRHHDGKSGFVHSSRRCNMVGTLGNHEFDEGRTEMQRLFNGGNHRNGPFLDDHWRGARFPLVSANIVDSITGKPILRPYVIRNINGARIAFIGATLRDTPTIVTPSGVAGLTFLDEAEAINSYVPELRRKQVRSIVSIIHQGGFQQGYTGDTDTSDTAPVVGGEIVEIVKRLDDEVDVVIGGHSHGFINALIPNNNGTPILVTQAYSAGTAFASIDLEIDRRSRDISTKSASIVTTWADAGPGLVPDNAALTLTAAAEERVAPLVNQVIGLAATDITRTETPAGESALGNLIADAQRTAMATDFVFMNPGGIRADIAMGEVTWGELFTVQPFNNYVIKMELTGQQVYDLLEQQWVDPARTRLLKISGLTYTWDAAAAPGSHVVEVLQNAVPIDKGAVYTVAVNSFIAGGGDNFSVLTEGANQVVGPMDLDALITYIKGLPQPFEAVIGGSIQRLN